MLIKQFLTGGGNYEKSLRQRRWAAVRAMCISRSSVSLILALRWAWGWVIRYWVRISRPSPPAAMPLAAPR